MKPIPVPPVEVSRMTLLVLVAAGAIVSIAASGDLSRFAGGFAVGAGVPLLISRVRRPPDEPPPAAGETP